MEEGVNGGVRMPLWLRAIIFSYMGWYGVLFFSGLIDPDHIFLSVFRLCAISLCTAIFAYGVICLIQDFKQGGIRYILNRLRDFFTK